MSKFNFESPKQLVGFLFSIIRSGETLTIEEENEILRTYLDFEIKEIELKNSIKEIYNKYIREA